MQAWPDELDRGPLSRTTFGGEFTPMDSLIDNALLIFAAIFVLGLAGIGALIARHQGSGQSFALFNTRERRLGCVEQASIGGGRKLLLVRRDNVEHLIMTGGPIDVVIETSITRPAGPVRDMSVHELPTDSMIAPLADRHEDGFRPTLFSRLRTATVREDHSPAVVERQDPPELDTAAHEKAN